MRCFVRKRDAVSAEVDGEVVAFDAARGVCFGLNGTASRIWQLIETPATTKQICEALLAEFKIDPATCEREALGLLETLQTEGLVATFLSNRIEAPNA